MHYRSSVEKVERGRGVILFHAALTKCELVTATLNYSSTPIKWPPSGLKGAGHLHVRMMHTNYIQKCLARLGPCEKSRSLPDLLESTKNNISQSH